jgi:hypothetical protein
MVTHSSTSRPVQCLCMAGRTGCPVFTDLWSYVLDWVYVTFILLCSNTRDEQTTGQRPWRLTHPVCGPYSLCGIPQSCATTQHHTASVM